MKQIEELPNEMSLSLSEYTALINIYIDENCDEVDGLIETIKDRYDPESTGKCKYSQIIEFMEEHKYLEADKEMVIRVLERYMKSSSADMNMIDYEEAIRRLI